MQAIERQQHAGFLKRLVVLHHVGHRLRVRRRTWRSLLISFRNHEHHESHVNFSMARYSSLVTSRSLRGIFLPPIPTSNEALGDRQAIAQAVAGVCSAPGPYIWVLVARILLINVTRTGPDDGTAALGRGPP